MDVLFLVGTPESYREQRNSRSTQVNATIARSHAAMAHWRQKHLGRNDNVKTYSKKPTRWVRIVPSNIAPSREQHEEETPDQPEFGSGSGSDLQVLGWEDVKNQLTPLRLPLDLLPGVP